MAFPPLTLTGVKGLKEVPRRWNAPCLHCGMPYRKHAVGGNKCQMLDEKGNFVQFNESKSFKESQGATDAGK